MKTAGPFPWLRTSILALTFAVLALTVLVQASPGTRLPKRDYGIYIYIGDQILHGNLPYRDAWDHKPPAIFYLNAAALIIGRGTRWGVWSVEFAFLFAAIAASFSLIKRLWGFWPAMFGTSLWLWGLDRTLQGGNFTEEYPLVFHFLALLLLLELLEAPHIRLTNFTLGLTFAFSFLFRPNNAAIESVAIGMLLLIRLRSRESRALLTHLLFIGLGVVTPLLGGGAYFHFRGALADLLEASVLYNLAYSESPLGSSAPLVSGFQYLGPPAWVAVCGYIAALLRVKTWLKSPSFPILLVLMAGTPLVILVSDPTGRNYGHYYINWLPFVALSSGYALYTLLGMFSGKTGYKGEATLTALAIPSIAAVTFLAASGRAGEYRRAVERLLEGREIEMRSPTSIYVENHTNPGERVLFWGALPGENFMSNRNAPYSNLMYPMMIDSPAADRLNEDFLRDIIGDPPVLAVDMGNIYSLSLDPEKRAEQVAAGVGWPYPPHNLEEFFSFIEQNYYLEAEVRGNTVYRLRGSRRP
jgi:hypothetical protein